jgi:hypothetical protein
LRWQTPTPMSICGALPQRFISPSTATPRNLQIIPCLPLLWIGLWIREYHNLWSHLQLTIDRPLNTVGMPYYKENLLSSWPSHVIFEVGAPPPKIDASILNSMTRTDLGFFAKNPRTKRRNQAEDTRQSDRAIDSLNAPKFLSEQSRSAPSYSSDNDAKMVETMETLTDLHLDDVTRKDVPSMYGNVEIKYSKFGVDDFDFAYGSLPLRGKHHLMCSQILQSNTFLWPRNPHRKLVRQFPFAVVPLHTLDPKSRIAAHCIALSV